MEGPFNIDTKFNCTLSGSLVCLTPKFNSTFPPFKSYFLYYIESDEFLTIKFILYEKRRIVSIFPTVFPNLKSKNYSTNIKLDNATYMLEGTTIIQLSELNSNSIYYLQFSAWNGYSISKNDLKFDGFSSGIYELEINYKNLHSLNFREQFTFSDKKNITILTIDSIQVIDCNRIIEIGSTSTLTIKKVSSSVPSSIIPFVKFRLNDEYVATEPDESLENVKCHVASNIAGVKQISLWYLNDAFIFSDGNARNESLKIRISTDDCQNHIDFSKNLVEYIFRKPVELSTIVPFAKGLSPKSQSIAFNVSLQLKASDTVSFLFGTPLKILFTNFPNLNLKGKKLTILLVSKQEVISFNCDSEMVLYQGTSFNEVKSCEFRDMSLNLLQEEKHIFAGGNLVCSLKYTSKLDGINEMWINLKKNSMILQIVKNSFSTGNNSIFRLEWYQTRSNFTFLPCGSGYGTESYQKECQLCPFGLFKSIPGIEICTNCLNCPIKMKSPKQTTGIKNVNQCVCVNNTMKHPINGAFIDCPEGAICNSENKADISIFCQCHPFERCLPDTPDNCTTGYIGLRCRRCAEVGLILIIVGLFLVVTSTQLTSMNIISTFTTLDINWPQIVGVTLAVAAKFNFDLLAPECIFRVFGLLQILLLIFHQQCNSFRFYCCNIWVLFLRSVGTKISRILKLKYRKPIESDDERMIGSKVTKLVKNQFRKRLTTVFNFLFWIRNLLVWGISEKSSVKDLSQLEIELEEKVSYVIDDLHGKHMETKNHLPWETEHDFQFMVNFDQNSDVEEKSKSMNEILSNIFSIKRAKKKGRKINEKASKILHKNQTNPLTEAMFNGDNFIPNTDFQLDWKRKLQC
eukprot:gene6199-10205_t